jgi:hypothetical protein
MAQKPANPSRKKPTSAVQALTVDERTMVLAWRAIKTAGIATFTFLTLRGPYALGSFIRGLLGLPYEHQR